MWCKPTLKHYLHLNRTLFGHDETKFHLNRTLFGHDETKFHLNRLLIHLK